MSGGVFICYRREETAFAARAIHDRLVQRLERENVFLDVDNIDLGVDWSEVLRDRVGACDALVAIIGRNWVSSAAKEGLRRIDDPDDYVRIEIEAALQRNVRVIPVLVEGAVMPKVSELPESLKGLARRQGTEISHTRFEADVEKLTHALGSILEVRRSRDAAEAEAARKEREKREAVENAERAQVAEAEATRRADDEKWAKAEAERPAREQNREPGPIAVLRGHESALVSAEFSPDGNRIVTASEDKTALVWDAEAGKPIGEPLKGHEDTVLSARFSPDGQRIVTASRDKTARVWAAGAPTR